MRYILFYGHMGQLGPPAFVHRLRKGGIAEKLTIFLEKCARLTLNP